MLTSLRRHLPTRPLSLLCWPLLALLAMAPLRVIAADDLLTMNMRDADIPAVIQWMAEQTGKQMVIDPRVQGKITVLANEPMTTAQAYQVFLAMMDVYGYAVAEADGIVRIFPAALSKISPAAVVRELGPGNGEQIAHVLQLQQVSATELANLLRPLIAPSGYINAFPASNSVLMVDDGSNINRLVKLARQLDQDANLAFETVALQHASAGNVAELVGNLLPEAGGNGFAIAAEERANAVMMSGDPATRLRVRQLIKQLDKPLTPGANTRVVYLNYLQAEELLPILKGISQASRERADDFTSEDPVSIEASASTNALVLTGPPALLDAMQSVIDQVDIRRAQVLVEAVIVEVSQNYSEQLGVEWSTDLSPDGVEAVSNFGLVNATTGFISEGLSLGYYRNGSLRALLQALATETRANILSTPSIVTLDNQPAEVLVGSNIPIRTGQQTSAAAPTDNPFTTISRQDIGLSLKITPQVNEGDAVTLEVVQEIETIAESSTVTDDIVTDKRSIKTKVLVEAGTILVLGGLVSDETTTVERKIPFLGDIPLAGKLFRRSTERTGKRNLMVFIHPVILDAEEVARSVTEKNYRRMQTLQEQFGSDTLSAEPAGLEDFETFRPRSTTQP